MNAVNVIGWTITVLLIAGGLLRALTVWLNDHAFGKPPYRLEHQARYPLLFVAIVAALLGVLGSAFLPLPGLWGPAVLVFAVIWAVNASWKIRFLPWVAPVELGLRDGERIVLLGGSLGTLIGYLLIAVV